MLLPVVLQGCIFEYPDCHEDPWKHVEVRFDTSSCPDADPEGMAVFLFPIEGGTPWRFDFSGTEGGVIDIPEGKYSLIAYNNDTYRVRIENAGIFNKCSFATGETNVFEALSPLTRQAIPGGPPDGVERICRQPQMMWCGKADTVQIHAEKNDTITIPLHQAVAKISVEISPVGNIDDINRLCAVLTGMSGNFLCHALAPSGMTTTIPFAINRTGPDSDVLSGSLYSFGKNNTDYSWVILYVWLNDGHKFYYKFNVTEPIRNAPDPLDIRLKLGPIRIPDAIEGGEGSGGMDVGVDGWDFIIIDLTS